MTSLTPAQHAALLADVAGQLDLETAMSELGEAGRAHHDGHDTEAAAAQSMAAHTGRLRRAVLVLLRTHPDGLTDDEGGALLGQELPGADRLTFGRRRNELAMAGLVEDSGLRRPTPRGRSAIVWRAVHWLGQEPAEMVRERR